MVDPIKIKTPHTSMHRADLDTANDAAVSATHQIADYIREVKGLPDLADEIEREFIETKS